jgi:Xaa-Pro aminopeptidase
VIPEFAGRRRRLAEIIGEDGVAILGGAAEIIRNHDVTHEFRQDSDFFYLTGFPEPDAVAVIAPGHPGGEFVLFVRPRDKEMEVWNGYRAGVAGAMERFGADMAFSLDELEIHLPELVAGRDTLFPGRANKTVDEAVGRLTTKLASLHSRYGRKVPLVSTPLGPVLAEQRLRKTAAEIDALRRACSLTADGHAEAMRFSRPGLFEYQVQAVLEYGWRQGGSPRNGYPSIVASGPNACVLHHVENDRRLRPGDLLLIDAAAEVDYYSSDVTRTSPVDGKWNGPQRAVYEVVLAAQLAALATCRPGATIRSPHEAAVRKITEGLIDLDLLPKGMEDSLAMHHYREYFMHGTSHWLGMDVHDAGAYRTGGRHRVLEPGLVFTVEPGIYIDPERDSIEFTLLEYDLDEWQERRLLLGTEAAKRLEAEARSEMPTLHLEIPEHFRGLGVRIEDDVLITPEGVENMTATVATDPDEIEALCAESPRLAAL